MKAFYNVRITKQPVGTAIMHKEPPLVGEVLIKITDTSTAGDYMLIVMECDETEHAANLLLPGVAALADAEAAMLAPKYQPKRSITELDPRTRKQTKRDLPAVDLKQLLELREERVAQAGSATPNPPPKKTVSRKKSSPKPTQ